MTTTNPQPASQSRSQANTPADHDPCGHLGHLSDFIDGDLEPDLCAKLETHLVECENCRVVVDTLKRTVSLYRTLETDPTLAPDVEERLWRRFDLADLLPITRTQPKT